MSRIADRIRAYVNDFDVAEHYGEWGILRRDQRRLIRELCDTCDMFEKTADELARKQSEGEWVFVNGDVGYDEYGCSVCGENVAFFDEEDTYNYCPNCGARMSGGKK